MFHALFVNSNNYKIAEIIFATDAELYLVGIPLR
jgi:hypothetical protein